MRGHVGTDGFVYRRYEYTCKSSILYDVALDNEGRIVLSGGSYSPYPGSYYIDDFCTHNIYVCRYLPDGQPDPAFGNNGIQELPFSKGRATTLYIEKDNRILIGGVVTLTWLIPEPHYSFIARLMPDGTPDVSFADNGRFVDLVGAISASSALLDVIKIHDHYYFGIADQADGDHAYFGLMRFREKGTVDSTFGKDGVYTTQLWLPTTLYNINQIFTIDEQSIYLSGYYSKLSQDNMMICKVKLNKTISSTKIIQIPSVNIFPNPFSNSIAVRILQGGKTSAFRLYNQLGQLALTAVVAPGENSIATGHLLPGIYFWEITAGSERLAGKVIKTDGW